MAAAYHKNPCPALEVKKFIMVDPPWSSLLNQYSFFYPYIGVEKKSINLTLFTIRISPLEVVVMNFTISFLLTLQILYTPNLVKIDPVVLENS